MSLQNKQHIQETLYFSLSDSIFGISFDFVYEKILNECHFFYFFLNWNFSLTIKSTFLKSLECVDNILMKGTVSSFPTFCKILQIIFLDFI